MSKTDQLKQFAIVGAKVRLAELEAEAHALEGYIEQLQAEEAPSESSLLAVVERAIRPRRKHSASFKRKVVGFVRRSGSSLSVAAKRFDVAPSLVAKWVAQSK